MWQGCRGGARCRQGQRRWRLPTPLLLVAGVAALVPLAALLRRPVSGPRLVVEALAVALAVIGAFWFGWVALWLLEQR